MPRAVMPGDAVAHIAGGPGSIGIGVRSIEDGTTLLLSCAHVFAPRTLVNAEAEDVIESPPILHSLAAQNRIGVVKRFIPFEAFNSVDAATCAPDSGVVVPLATVAGQHILGPWRPGVGASRLAGRSVWRFDKDRGAIPGEIVGIEDHRVSFHDGRPKVQFQSVIHYRAENAPGDSGSVVIDTVTNELLGIHFAGDGFELSLMCFAFLAFDALSISLQ